MSSSTRIGLRWALLGAAAAALIVTTSALGGSGVGGVFNLGQTNKVDGMTALTGTTSGAQLKVVNGSMASTGFGLVGQSGSPTGAGVQGVNLAGGPALQATVSGNSVAPLKVNSSHVVPNLHAANSDTLAGKLPGTFWQLGGNSPPAPVGVLGTTNTDALELEVNGTRALRIEPDATSPNLIGGSSANGNSANSGAHGATIAGGGDQFDANQVTDNYGTVGGGLSNVAGDSNADPSTAENATVAGGDNNVAKAFSATVGGGDNNQATAQRSTVMGGDFNTAGGFESAIAGGAGNTTTGNESFVAGGTGNTASGQYSFAAGRRAKATQNGSFVWGDSTNADVTDHGANTFTVRASGGTFIQGGALLTGVVTIPASVAPSVSGGNVFLTNNSGTTSWSGFTNGTAGQTITIVFGDNNTTVKDDAMGGHPVFLKGAADFTGGVNDTLTLVTPDGNNWYEVSRSVNH